MAIKSINDYDPLTLTGKFGSFGGAGLRLFINKNDFLYFYESLKKYYFPTDMTKNSFMLENFFVTVEDKVSKLNYSSPVILTDFSSDVFKIDVTTRAMKEP